MASFLILGSSSFYGKNFAALCLKKGDTVVGLCRPQWQLRMGLPRAEFDYIVNFVSLNLVPESWRHFSRYILTNVEQTTCIFNQLRKRRVGKFIQVSTPEVYGNTTRRGVTEEWRFKPSTPYAVTRAAADMMLMMFATAYEFPAIITRTANIYGPGQQKYRLIPKALAYKKSGLPFPLEGRGTSLRSWIHVEDACEGTYVACVDGERQATYHISTNRLSSVREIVEILEVPWERVPERLGKDHCYAMNSDKLRALGWQDRISLEEGLAQCASIL